MKLIAKKTLWLGDDEARNMGERVREIPENAEFEMSDTRLKEITRMVESGKAAVVGEVKIEADEAAPEVPLSDKAKAARPTLSAGSKGK